LTTSPRQSITTANWTCFLRIPAVLDVNRKKKISLLLPPLLPLPQLQTKNTNKQKAEKTRNQNIPIQRPRDTINPIFTARTQRQYRRKRIPARADSDVISRKQFDAIFAVEGDPRVGAGVEGDADAQDEGVGEENGAEGEGVWGYCCYEDDLGGVLVRGEGKRREMGGKKIDWRMDGLRGCLDGLGLG